MNHGQVTSTQGIHSLVSYVYPTAVDRTGAVGFVASDLGKLALQADSGTYWLLSSTDPAWVQVSTGGQKYLPLVAGNQPAGSTYTLIGALPVMDWDLEGQGSRVFTLNTLVQIPASSTAQVRLYDVTHTTILYESGIVAGMQTNHNFGPQVFTAPAGSAVLELWLATPTITGGNATCLAAGIVIT